MVHWIDVLIIVVVVCYSIAFPRMPYELRCHPAAKLVTLMLIVLLCSCVDTYGVVLSLLLVLSTVPCLQPAIHVQTSTEANSVESFTNPSDIMSSTDLSDKSLERTKAREMVQKMNLFTKINQKRDKFKLQIDNIKKDLEGVKEFYRNAAKKKPKRLKARANV